MKINYRYDEKSAIDTIKRELDLGNVSIENAEQSIGFIENAFNEFNRRNIKKVAKFAFLIPTRVSRNSDKYWNEVFELIPALKDMNLNTAFQILSKLPPTVIGTYGIENNKKFAGIIVFVPIFDDMAEDIGFKIILGRTIRSRINDAVSLATEVYGVKYVGLGATLPKLTNYGNTIRSDVVASTGHAGTVWLIIKTIENVLKDFKGLASSSNPVGFIGGGAIGRSAAVTFATMYPDIPIILFDIRDEVNKNNIAELKKISKSVAIAKSNEDLIESCNLIVSAVTSPVNITNIDLQNKVIIDDSQPGSFDRDTVESAGGMLLWVAGSDGSTEGILTKDSGYRFGSKGLVNNFDVWGCEAEIGSIAFLNSRFVMNHEVTPGDVEEVGKLFAQTGVKVAEYQSFGKKVKH